MTCSLIQTLFRLCSIILPVRGMVWKASYLCDGHRQYQWRRASGLSTGHCTKQALAIRSYSQLMSADVV